MKTTQRYNKPLAALLALSLLVAACSGPGGKDPDPSSTQPDTQATGASTPAGVSTIPADGTTPAPDTSEPTQPPTEGGSTESPLPPSATPTAIGSEGGGDPAAQSLLPGTRIISFYGHPSTPIMGVLGTGSPEELFPRLQQQAAEWQAADPATPVKMAFEIIATVAQPNPGDDGTYLLFSGNELIGEYVEFATQHDMIVILDLQIGHNTIPNEIERIRQWLELPNVHVALDPEFSTAANDIPRPDRVPGSLIGEVSGYDVQIAIEMLAEIVAQHNLPNKILIVHQFEEEMIYNKHAIEVLPGVDFVTDMDGFGPPAVKLGGYGAFVTDELIEYGGIKLFYEQDDPILDPATLLSLSPPPVVVIYQ
jgi:hypothetical protein